MKRAWTFLVLLMVILSLEARENPFKPVIDETVLPVTSNKVQKKPLFREKRVTLPSDARVLTSVTFTYQALDGSIQERTVSIDKAIDWHKPIVIRQEPGSNGYKVKKNDQTASTKPHSGAISVLPFLKIVAEGMTLRLLTPDREIRHFHLAKPFKIVIDFRRDAAFLTKRIPLQQPPFRRIDIGNHRGYYRVVVVLDAPYRYTLRKVPEGYVLTLR